MFLDKLARMEMGPDLPEVKLETNSLDPRGVPKVFTFLDQLPRLMVKAIKPIRKSCITTRFHDSLLKRKNARMNIGAAA